MIENLFYSESMSALAQICEMYIEELTRNVHMRTDYIDLRTKLQLSVSFWTHPCKQIKLSSDVNIGTVSNQIN